MATPQRPPRPVTSDALASYLADIRRTPLLSPEAEVALGRRIAQGDEQARQELVEHNLRFAVQVALKYQGHGLPLADLINEGCCGQVKTDTQLSCLGDFFVRIGTDIPEIRMFAPTVIEHFDVIHHVIPRFLPRHIIALRRALTLQAAEKPLCDRIV